MLALSGTKTKANVSSPLNKLFIYLFYLLYYNRNPATARSLRIHAKERGKKKGKVRRAKKRKGVEAERAKLSTPSQATDAHIGDEEQNGKQKKSKKKEIGSGSPTQDDFN